MAKRAVEVLIKAKDQTKKAVDSAGKGLTGLKKSIAANSAAIAAFGAAAVAAFAAAAFGAYKFLESVAKMEDQMAKAARRAQVDIQTYGEWSFVLQRAGGSAATYEKALLSLSRQMITAQSGSKEMVDAFDDMRVEFENSDGSMRKAEAVFSDIIKSLADMEDKTKAAGLAQVVLSRAGKQLIPVLAQTSDEIEDQIKLYSRLGGAVISAAGPVGEAFVDANLNVKTATDAIRAQILLAFGPQIVETINAVALAISDFRESLNLLSVDTSLDGITDLNDQIRELGITVIPTLNLLKQMADLVDLPGSAKGWKAFRGDIEELGEAMVAFQNATLKAAGETGGAYGGVVNQVLFGGQGLGPVEDDLETVEKGVVSLAESWRLQGIAAGEAIQAAQDRYLSMMDAIDAIGPPKILAPAVEDVDSDIRSRMIDFEFTMAAAADDRATREAAHLEVVKENMRIMDERIQQMVEYRNEWQWLSEDMDVAMFAAESFGGAVGEAIARAPFRAMRGEAVDLGRAIYDNVIRALEEMIVKMLVIKAISFATGGFGDAVVNLFGAKDGGMIPGLASGGSIPRASGGYSVPDGSRGRDSRLIMGMPGEEVINRQLSQRLNRYLTSQESAAYASPYSMGEASGVSATVVNNFSMPDTLAGMERVSESIVDSLTGRGQF